MAEQDTQDKVKAKKILAVNKKARFNYIIIDTLECGLELKGTEVKSLKLGKFYFSDSYARIENGELWLIALHITPYTFGNQFNHTPDRSRKLLAHKQEIKRLKRKTTEKGLTLIPISFYLKKGLIKVELALCKGKSVVDKRHTIKERDMKRDIEREFRKKYK